MTHNLPALPYASDALAPAMSKETIDYHYGKHLQTYIDNLNKLIQGTEFENMPLEEIVMKSTGAIFNNAAQTWNHTFFFMNLAPVETEIPSALADRLAETFGSVEKFKEEFSRAAVGLFGSGWAWLVKDRDGKLSIRQTQNAGNPMTEGLTPLLTVDVWEHAYYIDWRNRRAAYVEAWWKLVDWNKVSSCL